jgi:hypothetical protein
VTHHELQQTALNRPEAKATYEALVRHSYCCFTAAARICLVIGVACRRRLSSEEDLLGQRVEIVTEQALNSELRDHVLREAIPL